MKQRFEQEVIEAVEYVMSYKDFKGTAEEWTSNVWELFNRKNNWRSVLKVDVLQGGRDENGFYPNFIKLIVEDTGYPWEEWLENYNYGFKKYNVKVCSVWTDWNEEIDEYIIEVE